LVHIAEDEVQGDQAKDGHSVENEQILRRSIKGHAKWNLCNAEQSNCSAEPLVQLVVLSVSRVRTECLT
jgi:hypothetical protein